MQEFPNCVYLRRNKETNDILDRARIDFNGGWSSGPWQHIDLSVCDASPVVFGWKEREGSDELPFILSDWEQWEDSLQLT